MGHVSRQLIFADQQRIYNQPLLSSSLRIGSRVEEICSVSNTAEGVRSLIQQFDPTPWLLVSQALFLDFKGPSTSHGFMQIRQGHQATTFLIQVRYCITLTITPEARSCSWGRGLPVTHLAVGFPARCRARELSCLI